MSVVPGTRLGPYEVLTPIGAGGMGEVYRARDTRLDRSVAIKVLPAELAQNPQFRSRFEREAKAISSLNHPNICTLFDVGQDSGIDYLVMELVEGESLADLHRARSEADVRGNHSGSVVRGVGARAPLPVPAETAGRLRRHRRRPEISREYAPSRRRPGTCDRGAELDGRSEAMTQRPAPPVGEREPRSRAAGTHQSDRELARVAATARHKTVNDRTGESVGIAQLHDPNHQDS